MSIANVRTFDIAAVNFVLSAVQVEAKNVAAACRTGHLFTGTISSEDKIENCLKLYLFVKIVFLVLLLVLVLVILLWY